MISAEVYNPAQWNNFFVLVGTGSAALTGLVFVAISINLKGVAKDSTHRYRAVNMLSGFSAVFIAGCLALMGHQTYRTLGAEWLIVFLLAAAINTNGYIRGFGSEGSRYELNAVRIVGGSACYVAEVVGAIVLCTGAGSGLYISSVGILVNFYFLISGSWLLVVGTMQRSE